jgi:6-phosphogluconolactonase
MRGCTAFSFPSTNVHRIRGEIDPSQVAAEYEVLLHGAFGGAPNKLPRFDLVLLELGEDGHAASVGPFSVRNHGEEVVGRVIGDAR